MLILIFSIQVVAAIIAPDNTIINEMELEVDSYVYSREYDEIIYESDTSDIKLCDSILSVNYGKFLKVMSGSNFKPLKRDLFNNTDNKFCRKSVDDNTTSDNININDVTTLSARCPTYLSYVKCIYSNYIQPLSYHTHYKTYTNDFLKFIDDGIKSEVRSVFVKTRGGDLSFHLRQVLFQFCQFISYACPKLLDSFAVIHKLQGQDWYNNFACSAFDYITPIGNFNDLFDTSIEGVNEITVKEFVKLEIDAYINFEYRSDYIKDWQRGKINNNLIYTTIGTLYDVPINDQFNLNEFFFEYCVELCAYLSRLANLKNYYSKEGLARFYFICAHREIDCNVICGVCN